MISGAGALVAAVLALSGGGTRPATRPPESRLTVCIAAPQPEILAAQQQASRMFGAIDVEIVWLRDPAACPADGVSVTFLADAPRTIRPDALAESTLAGPGTIRIFSQRVKARVPAENLSCLLAHLLVHEIAHIAQGIDRHSSFGLMKPNWQPGDLQEMIKRSLPLTSYDAALIHRGLATRAAQFQVFALAAIKG